MTNFDAATFLNLVAGTVECGLDLAAESMVYPPTPVPEPVALPWSASRPPG